MWLPGVDTIVTLAKVVATAAAWQLTQVVTPVCVPATEYRAKLPAVVWHCVQAAFVGM